MTRIQRWVLIGLIVSAHLLFDVLATAWLFENTPWIAEIAVAGVCIGQIHLVATWAVLAPGRVMIRLPCAMFLAVLVWYALLLGFRLRPPVPGYWFGNTLDEAVLLGGVIVGGALIAQAPLWLFSQRYGWRLVPSADDDSVPSVRVTQFSIGHMLLGMAAISVVLALGRSVLPPGERLMFGLDWKMFASLAIFAVCSLVVAVPCIWGAFLSWDILFVLAFFGIFFCGTVSVVEGLVFDSGPDGIGFLWLFNLAQCLSVLLTLLVIRAAGFRLVRCGPRSLA